MFLIIDTTDKNKIFLGLAYENKLIAKVEIPAKFEQEEKLLLGLDGFLNENSVSKNDLKGIVAVTGPGSFSALRIGIATANALAWSLGIPIAGFAKSEFEGYNDLLQICLKQIGSFQKSDKKLNKLILPKYGKEPNINF